MGILAIMLISIKERTREIGLRRALGARKKDILLQFLMEALVLSLAGGIIGAVLGVLGSLIVGWTTELPTSVSGSFGRCRFFVLSSDRTVLRHISGEEGG